LLSENLADQQSDHSDYSCSTCRKHYVTQQAYAQHLRSKKHSEKSSQPPKQKDGKSKSNDEKSSQYLNHSCLFCSNVFSDPHSNLDHMQKIHGFILPDRNQLKNRGGLLRLLSDIIQIDHSCIYCKKIFRSAESAQHHMVSLNHCKVLFEDDHQNRYDISDVSLDKVTTEKCTLATNGVEMILSDGRVLGHRSLSVYYKQKFHPLREESEEDSNQKAVENGSERGELTCCRRQFDLQMRLLPKGNKVQRSARPNNCVRQARVSK
jgi:pre-60S factor REI1